MKTVTITLFSRLQTNLMHPVRLLILLACLSLALPFATLAQTNAPTPLPPAAQEALDKGIIAAKIPDYLLAIRYFEEARKSAPQAPVVYLNMGLAESRIPGRELRSIAWFGAYLAAYSDAPNAAAVREQIAVLEVKNQSNTSRFLITVQKAASQVTGDENYQIWSLQQLAWLWIEAGDFSAALKIAYGPFFAGSYRQSYIQSDIAQAQAKRGDISGARKTAQLIDAKENQAVGYAQRSIAEAQAESGDAAGALKTAGLIQDESTRVAAQEDIGKALARKGDYAGALRTAEMVQGEKRSSIQEIVARAQLIAGDSAGARKTTDLIQEPLLKLRMLAQMAEVQIVVGDIAGGKSTLASAQKTVGLMPLDSNDDRSLAHTIIARAQAKAGDHAGAQISLASAQEEAEQIKHAESKNSRQRFVAKARAEISDVAQPQIGPLPAVSVWLERLEDRDQQHDCPLNTEPFLDITGHLKSLPGSGDIKGTFDALRKTAWTIVKAQSVIIEMLKQEAKK